MDNYLLMKDTAELRDLSKKLGFNRTHFVKVIEGKSKKRLLANIKKSKMAGELAICRADSEESLRFALEKTSVDIVFGMEMVNPRDSVHFVRGGLDQITCKIAAENRKTIAFSFSDILTAKNRPGLMARMRLNIKLCRKYNVRMIFGNFSKAKNEMRSAKDLDVFFRVLGTR